MNKKSFYLTALITLLMLMFSLSAAGSDLTLQGRWSTERAKKWYAQQPWMVELDQFEEMNLLSLDNDNTRVGSGGYDVKL